MLIEMLYFRRDHKVRFPVRLINQAASDGSPLLVICNVELDQRTADKISHESNGMFVAVRWEGEEDDLALADALTKILAATPSAADA